MTITTNQIMMAETQLETGVIITKGAIMGITQIKIIMDTITAHTTITITTMIEIQLVIGATE
tara:strand:- start:128 stop:313 length:186 start_codon:yes stop_codon:yes gene_type:complete